MGVRERTLLSQALAWTDSLQGQSGQRAALDISGPHAWGEAKAGYILCFVLLLCAHRSRKGTRTPSTPSSYFGAASHTTSLHLSQPPCSGLTISASRIQSPLPKGGLEQKAAMVETLAGGGGRQREGGWAREEEDGSPWGKKPVTKAFLTALLALGMQHLEGRGLFPPCQGSPTSSVLGVTSAGAVGSSHSLWSHEA